MTAEECRKKLTAERYALARELWKHVHDRNPEKLKSLRDSIARLEVGLRQLETPSATALLADRSSSVTDASSDANFIRSAGCRSRAGSSSRVQS